MDGWCGVVWWEAWHVARATNNARRSKNQRMGCTTAAHGVDGAARKSAIRDKRTRACAKPSDVGLRKHGQVSKARVDENEDVDADIRRCLEQISWI